MGRYGGQKRRATTSKLYAMDKDYNKVLSDAKRIHRYDEEFYIIISQCIYSSVSVSEYSLYKYDGYLEHWKFENKRWKKINGMSN